MNSSQSSTMNARRKYMIPNCKHLPNCSSNFSSHPLSQQPLQTCLNTSSPDTSSTCAKSCSAADVHGKMLHGKHPASTTPFKKLGHSGMTSSQPRMVNPHRQPIPNTCQTAHRILVIILLLGNRPKHFFTKFSVNTCKILFGCRSSRENVPRQILRIDNTLQ